MKYYADRKNTVKQSEFNIGDKVLVKQKKKDKLSSAYCSEPYIIVKINNSMITAKRENHEITRNSSFFKLVSKSNYTDMLDIDYDNNVDSLSCSLLTDDRQTDAK